MATQTIDVTSLTDFGVGGYPWWVLSWVSDSDLPVVITGQSPRIGGYAYSGFAPPRTIPRRLYVEVEIASPAIPGVSLFLYPNINLGFASDWAEHTSLADGGVITLGGYVENPDHFSIVALLDGAISGGGYASSYLTSSFSVTLESIYIRLDADEIEDKAKALVYTMNAGRGKWSQYAFPFSVDAFAQLGDDLYIRSGDRVLRVVEGLATDDVDGVATGFPGIVQWPWLDMGAPGATKMLEGFDLVASGSPSVSVGYDQRTTGAFTTPYAVDPDTLPGGVIPLPVMGPSFALRVDFAPGSNWGLQAANLYVDDTKGQP